MNLVVVALGGAIGACARYLLSRLVHGVAPADFPYGTFLVNIVGCIAFGAVIGAGDQRLAGAPVMRTFLLIGVLGGFTTFSTYSYETLALLRDGHYARAAVNSGGQVIAGLVGLWAGYASIRALW